MTGEMNELFLTNLSVDDYMVLTEGKELPIKKVLYDKKGKKVIIFESDIIRTLPIYVQSWKVNGINQKFKVK